MKEYRDLVSHVFTNGTMKSSRSGGRTLSTFNYNYTVDLSQGKFPILTTKKVNFEAILLELLWFLSGTNDLAFLEKYNCKFWNPWKIKGTNKTPTQYHYWTKYPKENGQTIDQVKHVIEQLKKDPYSRRFIVSPWYPPEALDLSVEGNLPPCHLMMIFNVQDDINGIPELNLSFFSRSADIAVGVPYNLSSYSLLLLIISHLSGIKPGRLAHTIVDAHIYCGEHDGDKDDHRMNLIRQLGYKPMELPTLTISDSLRTYDDLRGIIDGNLSLEEINNTFKLNDYKHMEFLKFSAIV